MMRPAFSQIHVHLKSPTLVSCRKQASSVLSTSPYLHQSILPTYHFQECLPRLPVPKLEDTASRYLLSIRALEGHPNISSAEIAETEQLMKKFVENEGQKLHKALIEDNDNNQHTSYISRPWSDMYLESRLPLPLNYNPFMMFKPASRELHNDQGFRSTNFIIAAMKFQKTLSEKKLSPEVFYLKNRAKSPAFQRFVKYMPNYMNLRYIPMYAAGAFPLDMSQFGQLFNSTRIPCLKKDKLESYSNSRHVVVLRNGHFYKINTLDVDGNIMDPWTIQASINDILNDQRPPVEDSIAYLTTTDRDTWATARERLKQLNTDALEMVDSAIFCLVLEDKPIHLDDPEDIVSTFLHGNGSSRWFDKSFSLIVASNGHLALNFEHAWGDGVAVLRFFNEVYDESTLNPAVPDYPADTTEDIVCEVERLDFELDHFLLDAIRSARESYNETTGNLRVAAGQYDKLNKNFLKEKKVSPDGIMQLAIQAGYYRMDRQPAATYESCSTSAFKHGRTETIRSCTLEAQAAARAIAEARRMTSGNKLKDDNEFRKEVEMLIRNSCAKHNELTKEAAMGQGFDRHLFALRHFAEKKMGMETPDIFKDQTYQIMNHIILSTSTLSSHAVAMGGFAPVVPDGFGVGYAVQSDMIGCNITSYKNRNVRELVDAIMASFEDIYFALEG